MTLTGGDGESYWLRRKEKKRKDEEEERQGLSWHTESSGRHMECACYELVAFDDVGVAVVASRVDATIGDGF